MFKKSRAIVTVAAFISSTGISLAAGSPYVGASVGVGGIGANIATGRYGFQNGVTGNVFGGYGATFGSTKRWYLGGELNAHVGHNNITTYGLGASVMPGVMITQSTMVYAKLGLDTTYYSSYANTFEFKPQVGLGLQTELTKKIGLRGEYVTTAINSGGQFNVGLVYKFD